MERGAGDLSIGTLVLKLYYIYMRVHELRALRRLPAASMLPAGSRRAAPGAPEDLYPDLYRILLVSYLGSYLSITWAST